MKQANWAEWQTRYRRNLPPWLRFAIWGIGQILGIVLVVATCWIWGPALVVLYMVGCVVETYIDYVRDHPTED